jgi:Flp pilus assembly protein TadD
VRLVALAWLLAACGHPPTPRGPTAPSEDVRAEIRDAETAERARRHDVARQHYLRAVADANDPPSIGFARHKYAETLASWGEYAEAIAQYEAAVAATPDDAAAWHDLGIVRHHEGDDAKAIVALERARTITPNDPRPRIALAVLRIKRGDREGASREYRGLLALDLPESLRSKVQLALEELAKPCPGGWGCTR